MSADLDNVLTCDLVKALVKRQGVKEYQVDPYDPFDILIYGHKEGEGYYSGNHGMMETGPARILVVVD